MCYRYLDKWLMCFTLEPADQLLIRECHHRLHITTDADIVNAAGTHLRTGIRELSPQASSLSIFNWQLGEIPILQQHRILWNQILNTITFNNSTKLQIKLPPWTTSSSTSHPHTNRCCTSSIQMGWVQTHAVNNPTFHQSFPANI